MGALLASLPWMQGVTSPIYDQKKKKNVSRHYQVTSWVQKSPPLRPTASEKETNKQTSCELPQATFNSPVHCGEGVHSSFVNKEVMVTLMVWFWP